jgi:hypothetical protein
MLWLERMTHVDEAGIPHWEVKDVLTFNGLGARRRFLFSDSSPCTLHGRANLDLIVMAERVPTWNGYKPLRAWKANTKSERFEEIPLSSVSCR